MMLDVDISSSQPGLDDTGIFNDDDRSTSHSRSTSAPLSGEMHDQSIFEDGPLIINGKGKGKAKENSEKVAQVRVKEEPVALPLADMPIGPVSAIDSTSTIDELTHHPVDERGPLLSMQFRRCTCLL